MVMENSDGHRCLKGKLTLAYKQDTTFLQFVILALI